MANTYTQIYIQVVFAVQGRQNLISKPNQEELHLNRSTNAGENPVRGGLLIAIAAAPGGCFSTPEG